ncbi:hypothetical protein CRG98_006907 [Punica granatum]|uniref:SWIM-type domain-containing protein n=1 Tax=Punica granatum TaxID=22663 RepID=A0A2I0KW62_PUNGR|nr:hypothetical protein CRG98_006907 [Punica granatum]
MAKGKLILICQTGGEFTTNDEGSMLYNGGEAHAAEINGDTKFDDLKLKLAEMCDLEYKSLAVKYFLPQNKRILISMVSDRDLKRMYDFHGGSVTAEIYVSGQKGFDPQSVPNGAGNSAIKLAETVAAGRAENAASDVPSTLAAPVAPRRRAKAGDSTVSGAPNNRSRSRSAAAKRKTSKKSTAHADTEDPHPPNSPVTALPEPVEVDLSATPADTVKKRRRTASWRTGANGSLTIGSILDDGTEARESTPQVKRYTRKLYDSEDEDGDGRNIIPIEDVPGSEMVAAWKDAITGVGQEFKSVSEFREALQKYAIANRFGYRLKKNDTNRASGTCAIDGCSWKIHASWVQATETFTIKKMEESHTCGGASWKAAHPAKNWLVGIIKERLQDSPNHKPKEIARAIFRDFGLKLNYSQVWRGIEDAREQLQGSYKDAYSQLPWFCERVVEANPGSITEVVSSDEERFQRLFVCFHALVQGFQNACRPLLFLGATYLKSKYHEILLTASSLDGDDAVFPLAFAVVDTENDDNWRWFLEKLKSAVGPSRPLTFVADMEKGMEKPALELFENSHFGYSIFHLLESLKKNMRGPFHGDGRAALPGQLLAAAHALRLDRFTSYTEQMKRVSLKTYDWVMQTGPEHWATALFKGERFNYITSDVCEIYANWVEEIRELPILLKVSAISSKLIELVNSRRAISAEWSTRLTPSYEEKLREESSRALGLRVLFSTDTLFEVHDDSTQTHVVDLGKSECTCLSWKVTGLPCRHVIAVFNSTGRSFYDYCPLYFTVDSYRAAYAGLINPVPVNERNLIDEKDDSDAKNILPPNTPRPPSSQNKRVSRSDGKVKKREMTCSRCHGVGHNKATCKEPL